MKQQEHQEQSALMEYAGLMANKDARWGLLFAIPNGGFRHVATAHRLKKEGVKSGVPDLFLACPMGRFHGFFCEMKSSSGSPTKNQIEWMQKLEQQGYYIRICYGWLEARQEIETYLGLKS